MKLSTVFLYGMKIVFRRGTTSESKWFHLSEAVQILGCQKHVIFTFLQEQRQYINKKNSVLHFTSSNCFNMLNQQYKMCQVGFMGH